MKSWYPDHVKNSYNSVTNYTIFKMGKRFEQRLHERYTQGHKKMFNIIRHQEKHKLKPQRNTITCKHIRMIKIEKTDYTKCWCGREATENCTHYWWECKMVQPIWKRVWQFLQKFNKQLPYDPAIQLLDSYPGKMKTFAHTKTCKWMCISALFKIIRNWKQPTCPSTDGMSI